MQRRPLCPSPEFARSCDAVTLCQLRHCHMNLSRLVRLCHLRSFQLARPWITSCHGRSFTRSSRHDMALSASLSRRLTRSSQGHGTLLPWLPLMVFNRTSSSSIKASIDTMVVLLSRSVHTVPTMHSGCGTARTIGLMTTGLRCLLSV